MRDIFLSFLGAGYLRPASGTWGSLAALPAAWILVSAGGPWLLAAAAAGLLATALPLVRAAIDGEADSDPSWIVIDEVVGQWIALLPVAFGAALAGADPLLLWPGIVAAFLAFRLFDVWKPWVIGRMDRRGDALGLMLDDVLAGIAAALVVVALAALAHLP